ncbi:MAG: hypothetical protein H6827_09635 [Planctomycetes bacterium]|nr:hypothetical protein [Planctomycetota bacterium]
MESFLLSGARILSVPHCVDVGLVAVASDKAAWGEPIGWCPDSSLGIFARESDIYVGLRIWNPSVGDCWGHTLRAWLPDIFRIHEPVGHESPMAKGKRRSTEDLARECLEQGGYLTICGNAARYVLPGDTPGVIARHLALRLVQAMELEHFACGRTWPYPDQFRINRGGDA